MEPVRVTAYLDDDRTPAWLSAGVYERVPFVAVHREGSDSVTALGG